jgi:GntR family transcriptional regulator, transcriptional repressor for pyruvate dehydrogenase complex
MDSRTVGVANRRRPPKAAELLLTELRREIVAGQFEAGANLPTEKELAERFGVSRAPVREAIRVLETEGLIDTSQGARKGPRVRAPSARVAARQTALLLRRRGASLQDVYTARLALEPYAVRLLTLSATPAKLARLGALVEAERARVADPAAWGVAAAAFHEAVVELCGNATLAVFSALLQDVVAGQTAMEMAEAGDPADAANRRLADDAHERLIALVGQGDAGRAETFWRKHLEAAWPSHRVTDLLNVDDLLS